MRRYCFVLLSVLILAACSTKDVEVRQDELAVQAAKAYYDQLLNGDYASFVAGTDGYEAIPVSFREQLETNMKQYVARQVSVHKGIDSVSAVRADLDTIKTEKGTCVVANAFLTMSFADKSKEEIVVPMIKRNNLWLMR